MIWIALDPDTLQVIWNYESDESQQTGYSGYLEKCLHIPVPEGLTWDTVKGIRDGEEVTLIEDPLKVQAKTAKAWQALRTERNGRLAASDWTQLPDAHLSADKKQAWTEYRQALRDLPDETTDPLNVTWPLDPTQTPVAPLSGSRVGNLLGQV